MKELNRLMLIMTAIAAFAQFIEAMNSLEKKW